MARSAAIYDTQCYSANIAATDNEEQYVFSRRAVRLYTTHRVSIYYRTQCIFGGRHTVDDVAGTMEDTPHRGCLSSAFIRHCILPKKFGFLYLLLKCVPAGRLSILSTVHSVFATCSGHPLSFEVFLAFLLYFTHDVIRGYRILLVQAG